MQQSPPFDLFLWFGLGTLVDVGKFGETDAGVFGRGSVEPLPACQPDETGQPSDDEGRFPAVGRRQPRHAGGCEDGTDTGAGGQDADCQRAFLAREPLGHGLDRRGKVTRLAQPQQGPHEQEAQGRLGCRMAYGGQAPDHDAYGIAELGAQTVDQLAERQQTDGVAGLEDHHQVTVVGLAPVEPLLQQGLEQAEHLAVEVVDGGGEEQQGANLPAILGHGEVLILVVVEGGRGQQRCWRRSAQVRSTSSGSRCHQLSREKISTSIAPW
ncbi:hypothetical protein D3C78_945550 [compost metagenome]